MLWLFNVHYYIIPTMNDFKVYKPQYASFWDNYKFTIDIPIRLQLIELKIFYRNFMKILTWHIIEVFYLIFSPHTTFVPLYFY